jgi:ABC-type transport system substrate-binding protein
VYQGRCHRRLAAISLLLLTLNTAVACTNVPPPPLVSPTTSQPSTTPSQEPKLSEVDIGVDSLEGGFNPHALADLSSTTTALSSMLLPSVFRQSPDGMRQLDSTLMESAEVVPGSPQFTVRYRIRKDASWSDGAPIAAEDFVYLWQQLRSQPGVADAAGYQLIDNVASGQGGKTVEVTFSKPYPGWQTLFSNLLPAHLLRDAPRGWTDALNNGYPASGGPFAVHQIDRARGEITLDRNDRYWGTPAATDRIVLRASDQAGQVAALRSGANMLGVFHADADTVGRLRDLGDSVQVSTNPEPVTTEILLRQNSQQLADVRVRSAVAAALDRKALSDVGTGGGPADQLQAHAQVLAPSEPGYAPTEPTGQVPVGADPGRVDQLLTEAGYQRIGGIWTRDGRPLNLVIAAPFERKEYVRVAQAAVQQLAQQGIQATVVTPTSDQLFDDTLTSNGPPTDPSQAMAVDMAIAPRLAGGDPAAMMASSFGCSGVALDSGKAYPSNPAGFCDPLLQPMIEAGLTGQVPFLAASARVESALWSQAIALPLYQEAQVVAVRSGPGGVRPGSGFAGPLSTVAQWPGAPSPSTGN